MNSICNNLYNFFTQLYQPQLTKEEDKQETENSLNQEIKALEKPIREIFKNYQKDLEENRNEFLEGIKGKGKVKN